MLLPEDPEIKQPLIMGDPYANKLTPKLSQQKRNEELDKQRINLAKNGQFDGYANSAIAFAPDAWMKTAQMSGVSNIMTQPMWFSPIHTAQSWQTPSKRRECIQWSRFFFENEPKVFAAINFYSMFPMNNFKLECPNRKIKQYFEHHVVDRLNLNEKFKEISAEYFKIGDVFIHLDISCPICHAKGTDPDTGEQCNHPGGTFSRIVILNPDWVEVQQSVLSDEPTIVMIPDEELKRICFLKQPKQIYERIPDHIKALVIRGQPIPLSNRTMSHLKHLATPYGTYGISLIRCLFTTLAYKTKLMTANWIVAERLILPVRVVKVGSDERPATSADIADIQQQLAATANDPNLTIVTHHCFEYEYYGACHSADTQVLTDSGFKNYKEVDIVKDKIACFNVYTNSTKYEYATQAHEYDYDGELIWFNNKRLDILVTPNHTMLYKCEHNDTWKTGRADKLKNSVRLLEPKIYKNSFGKKPLYRIHVSRGKFSNGSLPIVREEYKKTQYYKGKVWCFTVPTGFFVTRRNGKITIQGNSGKILQVTQELEYIGKEILDGFMLNQALLNGEMSSYQSAQVGVETLIRRIESWRETLSKWAEENIFKPIAEMQGFIDEDKSEELGEPVFIYPKIKWNDLNLKDKTQWHQILLQLHDKQMLSSRTLMEELDLNYDQEIMRMRYETATGGNLGQGAMGGGAGGLGGMGGMGGGAGAGGMPGMGGAPPGGMTPMSPMGPGGAPGGGGMPGSDMGVGGPQASAGKILKKGKQSSQKQNEMTPEEIAAATPMIKLTEIEQKMAGLLVDVADVNQIPRDSIRVQYPIPNPQGGKPNVADFAIPHLKLIFESDGEIWHSQPDQLEHDKERDQLLAQRGWTVLRFDDEVIHDAAQEVKATISTYVAKATQHQHQHQKKASTEIDIHLFTLKKGSIVDLGTNYNKYHDGMVIYGSKMFSAKE